MAVPAQAGRVIRFGAFEVDLRALELRQHDTRIKLQDQPFQILCLLVERPGELVTRDELRQKLWPADTFVDFDNGLNTAIRKLRDALGDSAEQPRFVETIPRHGYRFIHAVEVAAESAVSPAPETRRRWWVIAAVPVLLALLGFAAWNRWMSPRRYRPVESVVVLPFQNLTGDAEQEFLADGVTDAITTELARVDQLSVPSVTSAMYYKRQPRQLTEITRELRVGAAVEGSIQRRGEQLLLNVQLVHGPTDRHLFARTYEFRPGEVQSVVTRVSNDLLDSMGVLTAADKAKAAAERPVKREAYEAYLRGRYHANHGTEEHRAKAALHYQQAIDADPGFGAPYGSLAMLHAHGGFYLSGQAGPESKSKARELALKALELDPMLETAHLALAAAETADWDWAGSEREFRTALDLNPNNAIAHDWYAQHLANLRRFEEAIAHAETARRLAPTDLAAQTHAGIVYYQGGRVDQAMAIWQAVLELEPDYWAAHQCMGRAYIVKGEYLKAVPHFEASIRIRGKDGPSWAQMAYAFARAGEREGLLRVLSQFKKPRTSRRGVPAEGVGWYQLQYIYLALDENDKVIAILEDRFERRALSVAINSDPFFDTIRSDARLHDLLRRMGVPEENIGKQPMNPVPKAANSSARLLALVPKTTGTP